MDKHLIDPTTTKNRLNSEEPQINVLIVDKLPKKVGKSVNLKKHPMKNIVGMETKNLICLK